MITISAFKWVPDFARGQVRDLRARLGAGVSRPSCTQTRLLSRRSGEAGLPRAAAFGQVPILEEDAFVLFESGSHRPLRRRPQRDPPTTRSRRSRARDAIPRRGAQFHRTLRHDRRVDRSLLRERGMGEAAPSRGRGVRAGAPLRPLEVAR